VDLTTYSVDSWAVRAAPAGLTASSAASRETAAKAEEAAGLGALVPVLGGLLASGGLTKILGGLKANGLSQQADSWVGTGPNEPVSGADMEKAVGQEQIQEIAKQLGVSESEAADAVAKVVPEVVDKVSPNGQLPPEQDLDAAFDKLAKAGAA
jgi:uncharacterized protein YidB (DUF937 family)